jgi:hypothetical protein
MPIELLQKAVESRCISLKFSMLYVCLWLLEQHKSWRFESGRPVRLPLSCCTTSMLKSASLRPNNWKPIVVIEDGTHQNLYTIPANSKCHSEAKSASSVPSS